MKLLVPILMTVMLVACSKTGKDDPYVIICIEPASLDWLNAKKAEFSSCVCLTGFRSGIYKDQQVIEIYGFDPLCNGVNVVYKMDGTLWFTSGDITTYADYTANVKDRKLIWTCSKGDD